MASYVVMERGPAGEDVRIVPDGFAFLAFLFAPLWFAFHAMWIEAVAALALGALFGALSLVAGMESLSFMLGFGLAVLAGLEARSLYAMHLRRRGWREWGVVEAGSAADAELRYVAEMTGHTPAEAAASPVTAQQRLVGPAPRGGPALGLFSYPGGR